MISASNQKQILRLINQRQQLLPQDVLERSVAFIDHRSDAQIWFEAFKDPNERMRLFNATTWDQLYHQCQGLNKNIEDRLNKLYDPIVFHKSQIKKINTYYYVIGPGSVIGSYYSLDLSDLKQLRSLKELSVHSRFLGYYHTLPGYKFFNDWSDDLEKVTLIDKHGFRTEFFPKNF